MINIHWVQNIMLSQISQAVKDKYCKISPIRETLSTKQRSKQNITRDMEIKNKLTMTRGRREGDNRKEGEGFSRNMYRGPIVMDNRMRAE